MKHWYHSKLRPCSQSHGDEVFPLCSTPSGLFAFHRWDATGLLMLSAGLTLIRVQYHAAFLVAGKETWVRAAVTLWHHYEFLTLGELSMSLVARQLDTDNVLASHPGWCRTTILEAPPMLSPCSCHNCWFSSWIFQKGHCTWGLILLQSFCNYKWRYLPDRAEHFRTRYICFILMSGLDCMKGPVFDPETLHIKILGCCVGDRPICLFFIYNQLLKFSLPVLQKPALVGPYSVIVKTK